MVCSVSIDQADGVFRHADNGFERGRKMRKIKPAAVQRFGGTKEVRDAW